MHGKSLQQSKRQVPDTNHVNDFHDSCPQQVRDFFWNFVAKSA